MPAKPVYLREDPFTEEEIALRYHVMQNTAVWHELRKGREAIRNGVPCIVDAVLSASSMGSFVGVGYYAPHIAVRQMQGHYPPSPESYAAYLGHHFEESIAQCAAAACGVVPYEVGIIVHNKAPFLSASVDRLTNDPQLIIECKHSNRGVPAQPKLEHLVQVMQQLYLSERSRALLAYGTTVRDDKRACVTHAEMKVFDIDFSPKFVDQVLLPVATEVKRALLNVDPESVFFPPVKHVEQQMRRLIKWTEISNPVPILPDTFPFPDVTEAEFNELDSWVE